MQDVAPAAAPDLSPVEPLPAAEPPAPPGADRLADVEAGFEATFEQAAIGLAHVGLDGSFLRVNGAVCAMLGYTKDELGRLAFQDITHPDDLDEDLRRVESLLSGTIASYSMDKRYLRKDGAIVWASLSVSLLRDATTGEPRRFVSVMQDLTERNRALSALAESEARLRAALEASGTGTFRWDIRTNALAWDEALLRLFGLAPGRTAQSLEQFIALVHPDDRRSVVAACEACATSGADFEMEFRVVWPDGQTRWLYDRGKTLLDGAGRPAVMLGACVDITARKTDELRLARSEGRFRAAVEAVSGVMWTNDAAGLMTGDQPGWATLTGQSRDAYEGRGWTAAVHPDDVELTLAARREAVAEGRMYSFEHRLRRADGAWRLFSVRAIPVMAGDRVEEWVGVHTDITEQREAQAVLARSRDELERLVEARTRELQDAQAQLLHAQRMQALGQLAGGIAHDFNNVLQAVQGGAALAGRRADHPEQVRRLAGMIIDATERGAGITRRLLGFARQGELRSETLEPAVVLASVGQVLAHTLEAGVEIEMADGRGLPAIRADRAQLETVLVNLATNARDAMGARGRLRFLARLDGPEDTPADLAPGPYVRFDVQDTGRGIPPEMLARVTEPFFTTKPPGEGTGLGLAMAKGFAEQSGGALRIRSHPGAGTTVTLWLPAVEMPVAAAETRAPEAGGAGLRLLLVEDHPLVRAVTGEELRALGCEVVEARDASSALAILRGGGRLDALITDLAMPGADGATLIAEARALRPGLVCVLITGYAAAMGQTDPAAAPFLLMRKPSSARDILVRIRNAIG